MAVPVGRVDVGEDVAGPAAVLQSTLALAGDVQGARPVVQGRRQHGEVVGLFEHVQGRLPVLGLAIVFARQIGRKQ